MLRLYYAELSGLSLDAPEAPLSDYRKARLRSLRDPLKRRQSLGAELLLRRALNDCGKIPDAPLQIVQSPEGKPYLADSALHFSLSHSGPFCACALADYPIGLDLERQRAYRPTLARRCFTPEEQAVLSAAACQDYAFTMLWTLKESCLKASGRGLRQSMRELPIRFDPEAGTAERDDARLWHTCLDGCHFSLCLPPEAGDAAPLIHRIKLP